MKKLLALLFIISPILIFASDSSDGCPEDVIEKRTVSQKIDDGFGPIVGGIAKVLFWDPFEAIGIYDPVVYKDNVPQTDGSILFSEVYGTAGSVSLIGHCTKFKGLNKGAKLIIDGELYYVDNVASDTELTLNKPLKNNIKNLPIYAPIEKPIVFIVVWLVLGAIFFTLKTRFINITGFKHALDLVRGKFDPPKEDKTISDQERKREDAEEGEVSHFQALVTALSATVGLGNIAGVAIAISVGGAGATFWLIVAGLLGMSSKFIECTLGVKYRNVNNDGEVSGGPMYYLSKGLAKQGKKGFGKVLAVMFAILCVGGSFGGGNMFQSNQAFGQLANKFEGLKEFSLVGVDAGVWFGILMAILVNNCLKK